jgi:hypothetical protein
VRSQALAGSYGYFKNTGRILEDNPHTCQVTADLGSVLPKQPSFCLTRAAIECIFHDLPRDFKALLRDLGKDSGLEPLSRWVARKFLFHRRTLPSASNMQNTPGRVSMSFSDKSFVATSISINRCSRRRNAALSKNTTPAPNISATMCGRGRRLSPVPFVICAIFWA